jgi:hypothetical protein
MPSNETSIGGLSLPVAAGAAGDALPDPAALVLLDYLGFWLRLMLNDKLASMGGDVPERPEETYADACPAANLFPYNPMPGEIWRRNPKPALYCWWSGKSATVQKTMLKRYRIRELSLLWVFCEVQAPDNDELRYGTLPAVDGVIRLALEEGYHPSYGYGTDAPGTPLYKSAGVVEYAIGQSQPGVLAPIPETNNRMNDSPGQILNYYPAVQASIMVTEEIVRRTPADPDDVHFGTNIVTKTNESADSAGGLTVVEIIVPGPPPYPPIL